MNIENKSIERNPSPPPNWLPDYDEWRENMTSEAAEFFFKHAEKYLDGLVKKSASITTKAFNLSTIIIGLLTASIGYTYTTINNGINDANLTFLILSISAIGSLVYALFKIVGIIFPRKSFISGTPPKTIMKQRLLKELYKRPKQQLTLLYYNECGNYQGRIEHILAQNQKRIRNFEKAIIAILITPIITLITIIILTII